jgi:1,4-dihydroxy-2-naphthoate octaprenyltransferase
MFWLGAEAAGTIDSFGYAAGQVMVSAAQITAHYLNEYTDREPDRGVAHRTLFSGGSGVLPSGELAPITALHAGQASSGIAVVAAAVLAWQSPAAALAGMAALAVSWAYSMPPVRLLATGWGELATSLVVAGLVPLIGCLAQGAEPTPALGRAVSVLVPVHLAMMLAFEMPDLPTDAAAGKRGLGVRIGETATVALIGVLCLGAGAVGLVFGLTAAGMVAAASGPLLAAAAAARRFSVLTLLGVAAFVATALAAVAAF